MTDQKQQLGPFDLATRERRMAEGRCVDCDSLRLHRAGRCKTCYAYGEERPGFIPDQQQQLVERGYCVLCGTPSPNAIGQLHDVAGPECARLSTRRLVEWREEAQRLERQRDKMRSALIEISEYADPNVKPPNVNVATAVYNTAKQALL